jgi:hypothetical protein
MKTINMWHLILTPKKILFSLVVPHIVQGVSWAWMRHLLKQKKKAIMNQKFTNATPIPHIIGVKMSYPKRDASNIASNTILVFKSFML